jgi:hypothetical protein
MAHVTIDASSGRMMPAAAPIAAEPYPPAPWELFGQAQAHLLMLPAARVERVPDGFSPRLLGGHALVLAGFIDPQSPNIELRVSAPDQYSFVIEKDAGGLQIVEYSVGGKSGTFTKIAAFPVATTMASARFIGPGGGVASYHMDGMYLWIGG